jgi:hypothetical protein
MSQDNKLLNITLDVKYCIRELLWIFPALIFRRRGVVTPALFDWFSATPWFATLPGQDGRRILNSQWAKSAPKFHFRLDIMGSRCEYYVFISTILWWVLIFWINVERDFFVYLIIHITCLVWCPGQNKTIAPHSFLHGCRKRRLKDL